MPPFEVLNLQLTAVDNYAVVLLNNIPILHGAGYAPPQVVGAGFAKFVVVYSNLGGAASVTVQMGINSTSYAAVPMSRVYPVQPGGATPVAVTVRVMNNITALSAQPLCPEATISAAPATAANGTAAALEPTSVAVPAGTCGYMYSSHRTPVLVPAMAFAAGANSTAGLGPSGINLPSPVQLQVGCGGCGNHMLVHLVHLPLMPSTKHYTHYAANAARPPCHTACVACRPSATPHLPKSLSGFRTGDEVDLLLDLLHQQSRLVRKLCCAC